MTFEEQDIFNAAYRQTDEEGRAQFFRAVLDKARESRSRIVELDRQERRLLARRAEIDREIARHETLIDQGV